MNDAAAARDDAGVGRLLEPDGGREDGLAKSVAQRVQLAPRTDRVGGVPLH